MMKKPLLFLTIALLLALSTFCQTILTASRMNEVFRIDTLVAPGSNLRDPWEITYGPDDSLWVTEIYAGRNPVGTNPIGYKMRKIHPDNGGMRTILDLVTFTDPASSPITKWQKTFLPNSGSPTPPNLQGGLMGLAIHPEFMTNPAKKFVYMAYVHDYIGLNQTYNGETVSGELFITWIVRFTYTNGTLQSPVALVDTIRGSNDHNSGRMIIAPEGGNYYLYYACGDMGAGQFANLSRTNKAQMLNSYEGKILRFNLEEDGDAAQKPGEPVDYNRWIPNTNPFNATLGVQSAVWAYGIRNNQGFAYGSINGTERFYGASHGPFSDDELNILENGKNFGHPEVIGYSADGNYNNAKAGPSGSSLPLIANVNGEQNKAASWGAAYKDPVYVFYPAPRGNNSTPSSVQFIYTNQNFTAPYNPTGAAQNIPKHWQSEAISGIDLYTGSYIPGWKNSILLGSLKKGRLLRIALNSTGDGVVATDGADTVAYVGSTNKFRDMAISPNGKDIFTIFDRSATSSGPSALDPVTPACAGCIQKLSFLGYKRNFATNKSTIPVSIPIAAGVAGNCTTGSTVSIGPAFNNDTLWVPITGPDGNIVAEIKSNGNNLGTVTTSFYNHSGSVRNKSGNRYLDRNITITPQFQPGSNVNIRLYITTAEFNALDAVSTGINSIGDVRILKNNDPCSSWSNLTTSMFVPTYAEAFGSNGYVLQGTIPSFSSFYFGNTNLTLPVELIAFTGSLQNNSTILNWTTSSESNTSRFLVERSLNGNDFESIGNVTANGNSSVDINYSHTDENAGNLPATIIYYRLKIEDIDGSYKYSNVVTVSLADIAGKVIVTPNPTEGVSRVTLNAPSDGRASWNIVDNTGRIVLQSSTQVKKGNNSITINLSKLAAGIYYFNVSGGGIDQKVRLQKL